MHVAASLPLDREMSQTVDQTREELSSEDIVRRAIVNMRLRQSANEAKMEAWRETKEAEWAIDDSKLRRKHPTREAFDSWLDKQCAKSLERSAPCHHS